jgi:hypothetical protein
MVNSKEPRGTYRVSASLGKCEQELAEVVIPVPHPESDLPRRVATLSDEYEAAVKAISDAALKLATMSAARTTLFPLGSDSA